MKYTTRLLNDGAMTFEHKSDYLIVKQVRNRGDESTNGSNNVGSWAVRGCSVNPFYLESNDLHGLLELF